MYPPAQAPYLLPDPSHSTPTQHQHFQFLLAQHAHFAAGATATGATNVVSTVMPAPDDGHVPNHHTGLAASSLGLPQPTDGERQPKAQNTLQRQTQDVSATDSPLVSGLAPAPAQKPTVPPTAMDSSPVVKENSIHEPRTPPKECSSAAEALLNLRRH
jgi:hypothetical protein